MTLDRTQIAKFVYVGQGGPLSVVPLETLLERGLRPEVVVVPMHGQSSRKLNLLEVQPPRSGDNLARIAYDADIPVISWQKGFEEEIGAKLAAISAEVAIMSCFPWRIPESLLAIPALGWWNLHPSLLPAYRGPTPLFWQARAGEQQTGITLHQVEPSLDSGAILGQKSMPLTGSSGLQQQLGRLGAGLVESALLELMRTALASVEQNEATASYQSFPAEQDRQLKITGKASDAYRYIKLVQDAYPLWLTLEAKRFVIIKAIAADDDRKLMQDYKLDGDLLELQFEQGVLMLNIVE